VKKELTKDYLHTLFEYKDGNLFWKIKRKTVNSGEQAGRVANTGYIHIGVDRSIYAAHRLIFMMFYGYFPKEIDHINGNKADNRIENLREVTKSQNGLNRKLPSHNTSGIKGVVWHKNNKNWMVQLAVNGKNKYFGSFKDLELAELVAIEARDKYHGVYARNM
jgi:hypothetical protein